MRARHFGIGDHDIGRRRSADLEPQRSDDMPGVVVRILGGLQAVQPIVLIQVDHVRVRDDPGLILLHQNADSRGLRFRSSLELQATHEIDDIASMLFRKRNPASFERPIPFWDRLGHRN
jgi:hypothetical protein